MRSTPSKKDLTAPCGLDCFNCTYHRENITGQIIRFKSCKTYNCVTDRGLRFCFECSEFPCPNLQPAADGADRFPHNMKVYNLCRMKAVGVERWAEEESKDIRARYFRGRFVVGLGPRLLEEK